MSASKEQLPRWQTQSSWRKSKRQIKKSTSRYARREGRRLLDDAPARVTRGYAD